MRKDIIVMAAGFFLIFLGFNTTIQYFTVSYAQAGLAVLSLNALALTFLFFFIGSFLAPTLISRIGLKTGLLIGAFGYAIFIYSVLTKTTTLVIVSAILQGLCAAILWISEGAYIIHTTDEKKRTLALGIVNSATFAGSFIGIFGSSFLLQASDFQFLFAAMAATALSGGMLFFMLPEKKDNAEKPDIMGVFSLFKTKASLFIPLFFATNMVFGFFVSTIMLNLEQAHGIMAAGRISSLFWLAAIFTPFAAGFLAEKTSKKAILMMLAAILASSGLLFMTGNIAAVSIAAGFWGIYLAGVLTIGLSAISNLHPDKSKVAGFFQVCLQPGAIFAFMMAGGMGINAVLYLMTGMGILAGVMLIFAKE